MIDDDIDDIIRRFFGESHPFTGAYKRRDNNRKYYSNEDFIIYDDDYVYITYELKERNEDIEIIPRENVIIVYIITTKHEDVFNLKHKIDPKSIEYTFNNFVLDIKARRIKEDKDVNEEV